MVTIITDSTCDLSPQQAEGLGIVMLSLKVNFGMESFADKTGITNKQFYEMLENSKELPTTSLLSVGDFLNAFDAHPEELLVLTLANNLSGTYQSAITARSETGRNNIHIIDTRSVAIGMALLIDQAVLLRDAGLDAGQIAARIEQLIPRLRVYAMVDTLKYLVKGGRLTGIQGALGGLLSLKPIVALENGKVISLKKSRGLKSAVNDLCDLCSDRDERLPICFTHSGNEKALQSAAARLCPGYQPDVYELGSVVGTHVGPGAVGIAYFAK